MSDVKFTKRDRNGYSVIPFKKSSKNGVVVLHHHHHLDIPFLHFIEIAIEQVSEEFHREFEMRGKGNTIERGNH